MFNVTLVDHLHMTFEHVLRSRLTHEQLAARLARRAWLTLLADLALLAVLVAATLASVLTGARWYGIVSAVLASLALAVAIGYAAANFERRIHAHRWCAARLWLFGERYRALLSELHEGVIPVEEARRRRDALMQDVQSVYEQAPAIGLRIEGGDSEPVDEVVRASRVA